MRKTHGARDDPAAASRQTTPLNQIESLPEFGDKIRDFEEVITVVRVAHDDERSASSRNPGCQSVSVTLRRHLHHMCVQLLGEIDGFIGAAVVGDYNFSPNIMLFESFLRLLN